MKKIILKNDFSRIGILTDENVARCWLEKVKKAVGKETIDIVIPAGEKSKTINQAKIIWRKMLEAGFDRNSLLINLGGGVIGDLGGFCASTFMRGIDFIQIPTTLLAMVDASVGGKTAVDLDDIKNTIGTFSLPIDVIIDVDFLKTLPKRELVAAFAEIIKHSIIDSREHFDLVTSKKPLEFNKKEIGEIIERSIRLKQSIVKKDFKELSGLRRVLNFGHIIGHAIESLSLKSDHSLLHGEAVAIGLVAESKLAHLLGLLSEKDFLLIEKAIINVGLPTKIKNISIEEVLKIMSFDKKNIGKKILWSLPKKIGEVGFNIEAPKELVVEVIKSVII